MEECQQQKKTPEKNKKKQDDWKSRTFFMNDKFNMNLQSNIKKI